MLSIGTAMDVDHNDSDDHNESESIGVVGYRGHLQCSHLIFARANAACNVSFSIRKI